MVLKPRFLLCMSLYNFHVLKREKKNAHSLHDHKMNRYFPAGQQKGSIKGAAICLPQTAGETRKAN